MMTTTQRQWVWISGAAVVVYGAAVVIAVALALGVPLGTILLVAAALVCPLAMYVGMRGLGMGEDGGHEGMHGIRKTTFLKGEPLKAIRSAIDEKYGPIGLPTPTPEPPG
jgi:hypothetical protein